MEFKGRRRIYADYSSSSEINENNVRRLVEDAMTVHTMNRIEIEALYNIEKNIQTLNRDKTIRPEINIIATDPLPSQIVDFKQGYEHGEPIKYTQRARVDSGNPTDNDAISKADDLRIVILNEIMRECKKASKDSKLARDIKIVGLGYRYIVPRIDDEHLSPYEIYILNPMRTFVIYSNNAFCEPLAAVTYTEQKDTDIKRFGVWTTDYYFEFVSGDPSIKKTGNVSRKIPIVEYINNYDIMGSFEKEIPLINAYNIVTSDRVNDMCQHVQSILWLHNTKIDSEQKGALVEGGVIQTESNNDGSDAKIQYVSAPLSQTDIQTLSSNLKERILESAGVPKLSEGSNSTGEAMRVTNGWHTAETQAKTSELTWRESEDVTLEICLSIIKDSNKEELRDLATLRLSDIDYDMHRSENYDIVSRVNAFVTLTDRGCDISKSAMYCKITDDPLQFAMDSEKGINKVRYAKIDTNTSLNTENALNEPNTKRESIEKKTEESIQPDTVKF